MMWYSSVTSLIDRMRLTAGTTLKYKNNLGM